MDRAESPRGANPEITRVLVIHTAFLGDVILATPALAALRARLPTAEIRCVTTPGGAQLLAANPWGVVPVPFDKRGKDAGPRGLLRLGRALRAWGPQITFCLHRSLRSVLLARTAGGETYGFREAAGSWMLGHRVSRTGFAYEAEKNLAVVEAWSGRGDFSPYPALGSTAADEAEAERLLGDLRDFVVMAPSSVWATKRWPGDRFGALSARLWREHGLRTVVVGGNAAEDRDAAEKLLAAAGDSRPLDLSGKTSLGGMKAVLARAKLVVSNDSSPLHLGIAVGRPVVGVFGPTTRELGFFPLAPAGRAAVAEVVGLECRPCGLHGHQKCPEGHFRCMLELKEEKVYEEVRQILCP